MNNYHVLVALFPLIMLTNCSKISHHKEQKKLNNEIKHLVKDLKNNVVHNHTTTIHTNHNIEHAVSYGLSLHDALNIALAHNQTLKAQLHKLGIAHADVIQAGMYQNPYLEAVFEFPQKKDRTTNIEGSLSLPLASMWQLPIKKKIAQAELAITKKEIIKTALNVIEMVKQAYNQCLLDQALLDNTLNIITFTRTMKEQLVYRKDFGLSSSLDINFAAVLSGKSELEAMRLKRQLDADHLNLRRLLGLDITMDHLSITDQLIMNDLTIPSLEEAQKLAQKNRPEIAIAQEKITYSAMNIKHEQHNVIRKLDLGIAYKQEFDGTKGFGPRIDIEIPLFDQNQAQIEKYRSEKLVHIHELHAITLRIEQEVYQAHENVTSLQQELFHYHNNLLPASKKAVEYAQKHHESMQLNMIIFLQTQIFLSEVERDYLKTIHEHNIAITHLESMLGTHLK